MERQRLLVSTLVDIVISDLRSEGYGIPDAELEALGESWRGEFMEEFVKDAVPVRSSTGTVGSSVDCLSDGKW